MFVLLAASSTHWAKRFESKISRNDCFWSRIQSYSWQHLLMKIDALPVCSILFAKSLVRNAGIIIWLSLYLSVHNRLSSTKGSATTKKSWYGSFISPSSIHSLIIFRIGAETYLRILMMNYLVCGLPLSTKVFIAEQTAPPLRYYTWSQITASHFIRSNGSWTHMYNFLRFRKFDGSQLL